MSFVACSSCGPRDKNDQPNLPENIILPFQFKLGIGSGMDGFNTFYISPKKKAYYIFNEIGKWKDPLDGSGKWNKLEFQISEDQIFKLEQKLFSINFFELEEVYTSGMMDGTQWYVTAQVGDKLHRVWCDNLFPSEIEGLVDYIYDEVLADIRPLASTAQETKRDDEIHLSKVPFE